MTKTTRYFMRPLALLAWAVLAASVMMMLASQAQALTYTVINTNDSGEGSLRQAILDANASSGVADTIDFAPSVSGQTITLSSELPAVTDGAGLTIDGGSVDITLSGNNAVRVFVVASGAELTLNNLTVANGRADVAGGILNAGTLEVNSSTISGNSANDNSGGIHNGATLTVNNSTISGNSAGTFSGGIHNDGTLEVNSSTISGNSAGGTDNGGIGNTGTATVSNSTISGNSADRGGGGIVSTGGGATLTVNNSTISGNSANNDSGGILNTEGTLEVNNSTISGNSAGSNNGGIGNTGTLEVSNSTISGNSANNGGGILTIIGSGTLKNTIVANNEGGNCAGTITDDGSNLEWPGNACGFALSADPNLGPLQDNGGPTLTHALQEGSPAIDQGNSFTATTDQRGEVRPSDFFTIPNASDGSDIGAFELQAPPDTSAPSVTCGVTPNKLSLPTNNHKLVTVNATVEVKDDNGSGPDGFKLVSVMSNQKDSGLAKDDVPNDIQDWAYGSPDVTGKLRAERYGADRVYTLNYEGYDKAGNKATCSATVTVPKKGG
jgi:hypothetical protein